MGTHEVILTRMSGRRSRRERGRSGRRDSDGNPDFDTDCSRVWRADAITKAVAMGDPGRHQNLHGMADESVTRSATGQTRFRPRLAPAATRPTHAAERHVHGHHGSPERFSPRELHFRLEGLCRLRLAEKGLARPLNQPFHGRKVDDDLVRKAVGRALARTRRLARSVDPGVTMGVAAHTQLSLTIGGGHNLVKAAAPVLASAGIMPETKECPLCGGT